MASAILSLIERLSLAKISDNTTPLDPKSDDIPDNKGTPI